MTILTQPNDCHSCNDARSIVQKKKEALIHSHSQQPLQLFSAILSSSSQHSHSEQPLSADLLSSHSEQIFSAVNLSSHFQQPSAAALSHSQQTFSAVTLLWSGVGGQLLSHHLWSGVGGQLFSSCCYGQGLVVRYLSIMLLWSRVGGQLLSHHVAMVGGSLFEHHVATVKGWWLAFDHHVAMVKGWWFSFWSSCCYGQGLVVSYWRVLLKDPFAELSGKTGLFRKPDSDCFKSISDSPETFCDYGHCVLVTFVWLTEGRSARDLSKQLPGKKTFETRDRKHHVWRFSFQTAITTERLMSTVSQPFKAFPADRHQLDGFKSNRLAIEIGTESLSKLVWIGL